jgi:hypothetical protein
MLCAARYRTASDCLATADTVGAAHTAAPAWPKAAIVRGVPADASSRPVFEIAGVVFSWANLIAAARIWGVWAGVERDARAGLVASELALERGESLARADLDRAGRELRYPRGRRANGLRRPPRAASPAAAHKS